VPRLCCFNDVDLCVCGLLIPACDLNEQTDRQTDR